MNLKHDGIVTIATGNSRKEKQWKNREMSWSEFLSKVSTTYRTSETIAEYFKLPKAQQDDLKDMGGYVGGSLKDGRRKSEFVQYRSLLTLDTDYASVDFWEALTILDDYACCIYSTRKHRPEAPRLRLVIPLKRKVSPEEYQAVARKLAESLGMEMFDDTTYEPARLMYWPSTSSNGEFVFKHQDGPWLNPDDLLASYKDWRDTTAWPVSSRKKEALTKSLTKKQTDPTTKEGIVGTFCRAYSMSEAIEEFLADVYTPCEGSDRYTYTGGSTFGGLVTYDDLFAYSHHSTDPAGGKLCNAFDLVRIHKFAELDQEAEDGTPVGKLPSFKAMQTLASSDKTVKRLLMEEKLEAAKNDFQEDDDDHWTEQLDYKNDGTLKTTIDNIVLIMEHDPKFKGVLGHNEFTHRLDLFRDLPWRSRDQGNCWKDNDDAQLRHYLESVYEVSHTSKTFDALHVIAERHRFNPVKDYLNSLVWDGVKRLDTLLIDFFNAEDSEYTRAVTRKSFTAAVARVLDPGCKYDYMLLLVGKQGLGKSYFLKKLGGDWYSDSLTTVLGKEAYEQLQGVWMIEVGELSATKKADVDALKHFITKQVDIFREAYGRRTGIFPRQCVFFGTTNDLEPLRDKTGGRRFWPVSVGTGALNPWNDLIVDQVWAEAVESFKDGEKLFLPPHLEEIAKKLQAEFTEESDKAGMVYEYLDTLLPDNWDAMDLSSRRLFLSGDFTGGKGTVKRTRVCALEVWCECFGGDPKQLSYAQSREIRGVLDNAEGWKRYSGKLRFKIYGLQRAYERS